MTGKLTGRRVIILSCLQRLSVRADQDCLKILENIFKKSIPGNTTVLVVEQLLGETPATHIADLQMYLVTSGGRERTYKHFKNLLKAGGTE